MKVEHVVEDGQTYAIRDGRRFKIEILNADPPKVKRKAFKLEFVKVPIHWVEALRQSKKNPGAYQLALVVLVEAFQRDHIGGEIVLSSERTGMSRTTRYRAAKELEQLGLIKLTREGNHALRVISIQTGIPSESHTHTYDSLDSKK